MMTSFGLGPFYGKKMKILQYQLPSRNPKKSSKPVQVGPERGHCTSLGENHASLSAPRACYKIQFIGFLVFPLTRNWVAFWIQPLERKTTASVWGYPRKLITFLELFEEGFHLPPTALQTPTPLSHPCCLQPLAARNCYSLAGF